MNGAVKDSHTAHWVNKAPSSIRPYLQLSRLDRPVGYWLLALPGWMGLAFSALTQGFASRDLYWAALILIGAIAMRGAGCTYNDIVDQDLDAQVERTALRPLPAGTLTTKQAWLWLVAQCVIGLIVLLCLPRLAQLIALLSIPLVAAYPFMKRITWWPQLWLGLTFNWAFLVAYAIKAQRLSEPALLFYAALIFWTVGYDTIYACQDMEDDAMIGIKSTARKFGAKIKGGVAICYSLTIFGIMAAIFIRPVKTAAQHALTDSYFVISSPAILFLTAILAVLPLALHFIWQVVTLHSKEPKNVLRRFKSNIGAMGLLILALVALNFWGPFTTL